MSTGMPPALGAPLVRALGDGCGVAAKVARVLLARPGYLLEEADFRLAGVSSVEGGRMLLALRAFAERGWCETAGARWRGKATLPPALPAFLEGAAAMRSVDGPPVRARAIITMPGHGSRLRAALPGTGLAHAALEDTKAAFNGIAAGASKSLVVLSPFLNGSGLAWALHLFRTTPALRKELVVRGSDNVLALLDAHAGELLSLGVQVLDYRVPDGNGGYETFHAKAVVADDEVAYVGSANLLEYERQSMELGLMVQGHPVHPIAALTQAIRTLARRVTLVGPTLDAGS